MKLKALLKKLYKKYRMLKTVIQEWPKAIAQAKDESYFPELDRKPYSQRKKENIAWLLKNYEANVFYTLYGLDIKGLVQQENFVPNRAFMDQRNEKNKKGEIDSQIVLLRDKLLFYRYMKQCGMKVPEVFGIVKNRKVYDLNFEKYSDEKLQLEADYFLKDVSGECASYVEHIADYEALCEKLDGLPNDMLILQRRVRQSDEMNAINPCAINTIRIVTINKDGSPYVLSALLRVGTAATGNVDNWARGGLAVGISEDGYLHEYGFYKPIHGRKTDRHPDSNIKLCEFKVPEYQRVVEAACKAHKFFYGVRSIGWDIAISDDGPVFIEGNDNWKISLMQACDEGLQEKWNLAMKE